MSEFLERITLTDDEGKDVDFDVIARFEGEDGEEYFIVTLAEGDTDEAIALKVVKDANGEEIFATVEDDEEFERVLEAYETLCDEGLI